MNSLATRICITIFLSSGYRDGDVRPIHHTSKELPMLETEWTQHRLEDQDLHRSELTLHIDSKPLRFYVHQALVDHLLEFLQLNINLSQDRVNQGANNGANQGRVRYQYNQESPCEYIIGECTISKIPIAVDFKSKDLALAFIGVENLTLELKQVRFVSVPGIPQLISKLTEHWSHDIQTNQRWQILAGVQPFRSLSKMVKGSWYLFALPWHYYYRKKGRLMTGLKQGIYTFCDNV
jgi:hypothetical protein